MFAAYCEGHGAQVLLPARAITALIPTENGIVAEFTCHCGTRGVWSVESAHRAS
jgi:hypothetical protein